MPLIRVRDEIKKELDKLKSGSYSETIKLLLIKCKQNNKNSKQIDYEYIIDRMREAIREELEKVRR